MLKILKVSILLIGLHLLPNSVFAYKFYNTENNKYLSDSIHENLIFEYDTVLLPPDTIRLTDTITIADNSMHKPANRKKINNMSRNLKSKNQNIQSKYSLSICFSPFITAQNFFTGNLGDSVKYSSNQPLNFYYEISSGLKFNNWVLFAGINFISFSEISKKELSEPKNETIATELDTTIYFLKIHSIGQIKNYFYYAGFLFGASYNLVKHNFIFCPQTCLGFNRRIPGTTYKFDNGINVRYVPGNEMPNYLFSFSLSPSCGYKLSKNIFVLILPTYVYNVKGKNSFPVSYRHNFRLGFGIRFEL